MFCVRCGSPMQPDSQACAHCGRRIGDPVSAVAQSRLERHLHTLAVLWSLFAGGSLAGYWCISGAAFKQKAGQRRTGLATRGIRSTRR